MASFGRISISHNFKFQTMQLILGIMRRDTGMMRRDTGSRRLRKKVRISLSAHTTKSSRRMNAPRAFSKLWQNGPIFVKKNLMVVLFTPGDILSQKRIFQIGLEIGNLGLSAHPCADIRYTPIALSAHLFPTLYPHSLILAPSDVPLRENMQLIRD